LTPNKPIPALDGFRALAITLVVLDHYELASIPGMGLGATGVTLFFVLSGFLITRLLLDESRQYGNISLSAFYQRRMLRIFPAFYCFWTVHVLIYAAARKDIHWPEVGSAFFYFSNYYAGVFDPPNMAMLFTWSLAAEEQFYLLWPALFSRFQLRLVTLTRILGALILCAPLVRFAAYTLLHAKLRYLYSAFECRVDALLIGCLTAVLIRRGIFERFTAVVHCHASAPAISIALLAGLVSLESAAPAAFGYIIGFSLEAILAALLLTQLVAFHASAAWKWIDSPVLKYLGRISYPLYLYHLLVRDIVARLGENWPLPARQIVQLSAVLIVAAGSYRLIESPFLKLKRRAGRYSAETSGLRLRYSPYASG
jgi:peptidoglycan/LPS O-acetylase OafA/YrhL